MFYTLFYTFDAVDVDEKLNTCNGISEVFFRTITNPNVRQMATKT